MFRTSSSGFLVVLRFLIGLFDLKGFQVYFHNERKVLKTYKNTFQKYLKIFPQKFQEFQNTLPNEPQMHNFAGHP